MNLEQATFEEINQELTFIHHERARLKADRAALLQRAATLATRKIGDEIIMLFARKGERTRVRVKCVITNILPTVFEVKDTGQLTATIRYFYARVRKDGKPAENATYSFYEPHPPPASYQERPQW